MTDKWGDVVTPQRNDKIDYQDAGTRTVAPGGELRLSWPGLQFISGSALNEYHLRLNARYQVVAVYRPDGMNGPVFASPVREVEIPDIR